jgi:hypothetical protein
MKAFVRSVLALVAVLSSGGALGAVGLQNLLDRNPFAPSGQAAVTGTPAEQGVLELRGVVTDATGTAYSIFDASTSKGRWVRSDDLESPYVIRNYDPVNGLLELEQNGRPLKLALKRVSIQAGAPISLSPPNPAGGPGQTVSRDAAADAKRLEAVAAEVRRRRALRNASRNAPQGQPPAAQAAAPAETPAPSGDPTP